MFSAKAAAGQTEPAQIFDRFGSQLDGIGQQRRPDQYRALIQQYMTSGLIAMTRARQGRENKNLPLSKIGLLWFPCFFSEKISAYGETRRAADTRLCTFSLLD